jgi:A/G-specific adenine glycosylase
MAVRAPIRAVADSSRDTGFSELGNALLAWYGAHGRRLSFRETRDPWAILVSEVMLQQTQVSRIEAAWLRFIIAFPTPHDLAEATPAAVLRAWAGLGYNRRAVNLQRAARAICEVHGGSVPQDIEELEALPGIGGYTARAVAAIAFGVPVAAIDTNLRRVLGRVLVGHGWQGDPGLALSPVELQARADELVDRHAPGAWTHALMDVGATTCRPQAPDCAACPLSAACRYAAEARVSRSVPNVAGATTSSGSLQLPVPRRAPDASFPSTTRWLRGRIIDRLRSSADGRWVRLDEPIGAHGTEAVASAISTLERDGLLERNPDGGVRLPSTAQ